MENTIKVYIKLDSNNVICQINSSVFLSDITGWTQIDEGNGDKYAHAQGNYLEKGLVDNKGRYNYKYNNGLVELTEEEKQILYPPQPYVPTEQERMASLEQAMNDLLLGGM